MSKIYIAVDVTTHSPKWWESLKIENLSLHNHLSYLGEIIMDSDEDIATFTEPLSSLPGWFTGDPESPHPVLIREAQEDERIAIEEEISVGNVLSMGQCNGVWVMYFNSFGGVEKAYHRPEYWGYPINRKTALKWWYEWARNLVQTDVGSDHYRAGREALDKLLEIPGSEKYEKRVLCLMDTMLDRECREGQRGKDWLV
jgi:hypothetical protein